MEDPEDRVRFRELGIQYLMSPTKIVATLIGDLLRFGAEANLTPFDKILVPILDKNTVEKIYTLTGDSGLCFHHPNSFWQNRRSGSG